ncbi:MAG: zinc-ribbon domain-containing protein, partial [Paracoccus sp. (in: a-proteobacteria)]
SLICPACDAEYRLPEAAIPPAGREVECSACGRVWMAHGRQAQSRAEQRPSLVQRPATPAAAPLPPPSSRLPANVLDILKEEAERERLLRAAENAADGAGASRTAPPPPPEDEADWPATTVILPAASLPGGSARAILAAPQPQPPLLQPPVMAPDPAPEAPQVIRHPVTSSASTDAPQPPAPPARSGSYRTGFGLAVMLAACFVALYLLAPGLSDGDNPLGQQLMDLRLEVDRGRLWLQDQARALTG